MSYDTTELTNGTNKIELKEKTELIWITELGT